TRNVFYQAFFLGSFECEFCFAGSRYDELRVEFLAKFLEVLLRIGEVHLVGVIKICFCSGWMVLENFLESSSFQSFGCFVDRFAASSAMVTCSSLTPIPASSLAKALS